MFNLGLSSTVLINALRRVTGTECLETDHGRSHGASGAAVRVPGVPPHSADHACFGFGHRQTQGQRGM